MADTPLFWFHYFNSAVQEENRDLRIEKIRTALHVCSVDLVRVGQDSARFQEHRRICQAMTDLRMLYALSLKYVAPVSV